MLTADYFNEYPFAPPAVELSVKNLLPCPEIESAVGDGDHDLSTHDLPLHVGIGIVLTHVVLVGGHWFVGRDFLQPDIVVVVQAGLVVIDEDRRGDVHGIAEHQTVCYPAFVDALLHFRGDVDKGPACGHLEPQFFSIAFHMCSPCYSSVWYPWISIVTLTLQKPEGFRVKASEGEVVVFYFELSATQNLKFSGFPGG